MSHDDEHSDRPFVIINQEDVATFLSSQPSPENLDNLTKHELQLIAHYLEVDVRPEWNKHSIVNALKSHLFGTSHPYEGSFNVEEGEGQVQSDAQVVHNVPPLLQSLPTPIQMLSSNLPSADYLKLREKEIQLEHEKLKVEQERLRISRERHQLENQQRESDRILRTRELELRTQTNDHFATQSTICRKFSDRLSHSTFQ